jgi:hypothetical protein
MNDTEDHQVASLFRQGLNESLDKLPNDVLFGLKQSRMMAVSSYRNRVERRTTHGISHVLAVSAFPLRIVAITVALSLGIVGTYYWNQFEQAAENEEIDSALLSDELPPEIYTDSGFHSWLEQSRSSSLL